MQCVHTVFIKFVSAKDEKDMVLPQEFTAYTRALMGNELYEKLLVALEQEPPVSLRLNPFKTKNGETEVCNADEHVAWTDYGYSTRFFTQAPIMYKRHRRCLWRG